MQSVMRQVSVVMQAHLRSGQQTRQQVIKKQRTNRMLMAVTGIFVGCWLPLNVIHLTFDYYEKVGLACLLGLCFVTHGQIPLRYLVADRPEAGRGRVTDLLARASSLLAG